MGRALFTLMVLVVIACGCKKQVEVVPQPPVVEFHFGDVVVTAQETMAIVMADMPYVTIDDKYDHDMRFKLAYRESLADTYIYIEEYDHQINKVHFKLFDLQPDTTYIAHIYLESSTGEYATSDEFMIATEGADEGMRVYYNIDIATRGLFATMTLNDLRYMVGSTSVPFSVVLEYRRNHSTPQEWVVYECAAEEIVDEKLVIELPAEGHDYLFERDIYEYRISFIPEDESYETLNKTTDIFYTSPAVITYDISTPQATYDNGVVRVASESIELFYDGISEREYTHDYPSYRLYYREKGVEEWVNIRAERDGDRLISAFGAHNVAPDTIYEIMMVAYVGRSHTQCCSEIIELLVSTSTPDNI